MAHAERKIVAAQKVKNTGMAHIIFGQGKKMEKQLQKACQENKLIIAKRR